MITNIRIKIYKLISEFRASSDTFFRFGPLFPAKKLEKDNFLKIFNRKHLSWEDLEYFRSRIPVKRLRHIASRFQVKIFFLERQVFDFKNISALIFICDIMIRKLQKYYVGQRFPTFFLFRFSLIIFFLQQIPKQRHLSSCCYKDKSVAILQFVLQ